MLTLCRYDCDDRRGRCGCLCRRNHVLRGSRVAYRQCLDARWALDGQYQMCGVTMSHITSETIRMSVLAQTVIRSMAAIVGASGSSVTESYFAIISTHNNHFDAEIKP